MRDGNEEIVRRKVTDFDDVAGIPSLLQLDEVFFCHAFEPSFVKAFGNGEFAVGNRGRRRKRIHNAPGSSRHIRNSRSRRRHRLLTRRFLLRARLRLIHAGKHILQITVAGTGALHLFCEKKTGHKTHHEENRHRHQKHHHELRGAFTESQCAQKPGDPQRSRRPHQHPLPGGSRLCGCRIRSGALRSRLLLAVEILLRCRRGCLTHQRRRRTAERSTAAEARCCIRVGHRRHNHESHGKNRQEFFHSVFSKKSRTLFPSTHRRSFLESPLSILRRPCFLSRRRRG